MKHVAVMMLVCLMLGVSVGNGLSKKRGGAVWYGKQVIVRDSTSDGWQPHVEAMVAMFNAMLPKRAPRLVYQRMEAQPCVAVKRQRGIAVCVDATPEWVGVTEYRLRPHRRFDRVSIQLQPWKNGMKSPATYVCHEFVHATTGIPDTRFWQDADGIWQSSRMHTSCVWGSLDAPGSFDRHFAQWVYKAYGKQRRGKHR